MPTELLIVDACVLIDYITTEPSILTLGARHVATIYLASVVLAEVDDLDASRAVSLGLTVVEPELALAAEAAANQRGTGLSFEDWVSLLLAKTHGWTCVTNDRRLRRECTSHDIELMWGLGLLEQLVRNDALTAKAAISTATAIHEGNPRHITSAILARFEKKVSGKGT